MTDDLFSLPELPYAGTSGWSGSDTSRARTVTADKDGRTAHRQQATLSSLAQAGTEGLTWKELSEIHGWHHGTASGSLSVLHKTERILRLTETRNRCKVYVLPDHAMGRTTEPHRSRMTPTAGNLPEVQMLTERQADALIAGQPSLVSLVARKLDEPGDRQAQAEQVIAAVADWLSSYRPEELGDTYCTPLDVTAFILRKGQMIER